MTKKQTLILFLVIIAGGVGLFFINLKKSEIVPGAVRVFVNSQESPNNPLLSEAERKLFTNPVSATSTNQEKSLYIRTMASSAVQASVISLNEKCEPFPVVTKVSAGEKLAFKNDSDRQLTLHFAGKDYKIGAQSLMDVGAISAGPTPNTHRIIRYTCLDLTTSAGFVYVPWVTQ